MARYLTSARRAMEGSKKNNPAEKEIRIQNMLHKY
jgi:hypothetical protein